MVKLHNHIVFQSLFIERIDDFIIRVELAIRGREQNPSQPILLDCFLEIIKGLLVESVGLIHGLQAAQTDEKIGIPVHRFTKVLFPKCGVPYPGHVLTHCYCFHYSRLL